MGDSVNQVFEGVRMFLARQSKKMTLRELAGITGISYSYLNRIEKHQIKPTQDMIKTITKTLDLSFVSRPDTDKTFREEQFPSLYNFNMYGEYEQARSLYQTLKENESYFINSPVFLQYYLIMATTIVHTRTDYERMDAFQKTCELLIDYMSDFERELTFVNRIVHNILKGRMRAVKEETTTLLQTMKDEHLRARIHYISGMLKANDYRYYNEALTHYDKAKSIFETYMNYDRLNRTETMQQIIYLYQYQFETFEKSLEKTRNYAQTHARVNLFHLTKINEARYMILREKYSEAAAILDEFYMAEGSYYFYKIYAYFKVGRNMEALEILSSMKHHQNAFISHMESVGLDTIAYLLTHEENETEALKPLRRFCNTAHENYDFLMIQLATELLTGRLIKQRRYKEAHAYAQKFLRVLYTMVR